MKHSYGRIPLYMLKPKALIDSLLYRDPCAIRDGDDVEERREIDEKTGLRIYSLNEVRQHDIIGDCWIILYDKVYDMTKFLTEHPGGEDVILENAGRDATIAFRSVGHSSVAIRQLESFLVGTLPEKERIFKSDGAEDSRWSIL